MLQRMTLWDILSYFVILREVIYVRMLYNFNVQIELLLNAVQYLNDAES